MTLSKHARAVLHALAQGYRVTESLTVLAPNGSERATRQRAGRYPYPTFNIAFEDGSFPVAVHKLAAAQLFGEAALLPGVHVRHRDDNPENFAPSNLMLGTQSLNELDKSPETRRRVALLAASKRRVLTDKQALRVVALKAKGWTGKRLAAHYGIRKSTVSEILSGKIYSEATGLTRRVRKADAATEIDRLKGVA